MKFLIDADCPRSLGEELQKAGYEVYDIRDLQPGASDEEIYNRIRKESFILITRDTDFSNFLRFPPTPHCGIILLRTLLLPVPSIRALVQDVIRTIPEKDIWGSLIVARPGRYRIRSFKP